MGANITIKDRMAIVSGVQKLYGASVVASDLRGGAGLVLAGLVADGYTTIDDIYMSPIWLLSLYIRMSYCFLRPSQSS